MCMLDTIHEKRDSIYNLVHQHKGSDVYVFGSCARKEETPDSDVDFLITFNGAGGFDIIDLGDRLEEMLGRKVDIASSKALETSPCFAYNVRKDMVAI